MFSKQSPFCFGVSTQRQGEQLHPGRQPRRRAGIFKKGKCEKVQALGAAWGKPERGGEGRLLERASEKRGRPNYHW